MVISCPLARGGVWQEDGAGSWKKRQSSTVAQMNSPSTKSHRTKVGFIHWGFLGSFMPTAQGKRGGVARYEIKVACRRGSSEAEAGSARQHVECEAG